jgi:hypothetical protein
VAGKTRSAEKIAKDMFDDAFSADVHAGLRTPRMPTDREQHE